MYLRSYLLIALLCVSFSFAKAIEPTVRTGPVPAWVIPAKQNDERIAGTDLREVNDGYYIRLYEQEENVEKKETYTHLIREIVSDAGVQRASDITIHFEPAYEQLTVHQVIVWRNGIPISKLQQGAFKMIANEQDLSRFLYNGNYTAYLILDDIRKGDRVEWSYTTSGRNPVFENKFFTSFVLGTPEPVAHIHYSILMPASRKLNFRYLNDGPHATEKIAGNTKVYDWDLVNVPAVETPTSLPAWYNHFPFVQMSEYNDWGEVAAWAYKVNTPPDKLTGELGARVAKVKEQYNDKDSLLRALVQIVQNDIRYMGIEIGPYSHKANAPGKVYAQRYGDCKDKSLLLVSMLRSVGIDANMALVGVQLKDKIADRWPSPSLFDHAVVLAQVSGRPVWIDPTLSDQGGSGSDIYFPHRGQALVLAPGTKELTTMPEGAAGEVRYTEIYDITDTKDAVSLTVNTTYYGHEAEVIRRELATKSKSSIEKNYLDYYLKTYPGIERKDTLAVLDDIRSNTVETIEHYTINDFFDHDSVAHNYPVSFYVSSIRNVLPSVKNNKKYPIAVSYPYNMHYTIQVNAPLQWQIQDRSETIERDAYRFAQNVSTNNNTLSLEYEFRFLKDHIAPEDIAQYEADSKKLINEHLSFSFTYTPSSDETYTGYNTWGILLFLITLGGCVYLGTRIYRTHTERDADAYAVSRNIGGWLILPLLGLVISILRILTTIFTGGYFRRSLWHVYDAHDKAVLYKVFLSAEFFINTIVLSLSIFCLVLMLARRDILPRYIKMLYIGSAIFVTMDDVLTNMIFNITEIDYKNIGQSIFAACIWVPYFSMAQRVRETFVVPYPDIPIYYYEPEPQPIVGDVAAVDTAAPHTPEAEGDGTE
ncbi:hypothetical protein GCM10023093_31720 [Nemorincola caseinilytica]|uniref:DUF3857 domain-containing protein n=1 Tax=Nemorincola caseinilytica TaxID=2054315 RepID=A0ABP8NT22_9BACT